MEHVATSLRQKNSPLLAIEQSFGYTGAKEGVAKAGWLGHWEPRWQHRRGVWARSPMGGVRAQVLGNAGWQEELGADQRRVLHPNHFLAPGDNDGCHGCHGNFFCFGGGLLWFSMFFSSYWTSSVFFGTVGLPWFVFPVVMPRQTGRLLGWQIAGFLDQKQNRLGRFLGGWKQTLLLKNAFLVVLESFLVVFTRVQQPGSFDPEAQTG